MVFWVVIDANKRSLVFIFWGFEAPESGGRVILKEEERVMFRWDYDPCLLSSM